MNHTQHMFFRRKRNIRNRNCSIEMENNKVVPILFLALWQNSTLRFGDLASDSKCSSFFSMAEWCCWNKSAPGTPKKNLWAKRRFPKAEFWLGPSQNNYTGDEPTHFEYGHCVVVIIVVVIIENAFFIVFNRRSPLKKKKKNRSPRSDLRCAQRDDSATPRGPPERHEIEKRGADLLSSHSAHLMGSSKVQ